MVRAGGTGLLKVVAGGFAVAVAASGCGGGSDGGAVDAQALRDARPLAAPTERAANLGYTTVTADDLLNWAEQAYPQFFPGRQANQAWAPYIYRYYPSTGNYVGLDGDKVFILGPVSEGLLRQVGIVYQYACQVKPADCVAPSFVQPPQSRTMFAGRMPVFETLAGGGPSLEYQWFRDGQAIPGANGSSYTVTTPATKEDMSLRYTVRVSNAKGSVTSEPVRIEVVDRIDRATLDAMSREKGCFACHDIETRLQGPTYKQIAERYTPRQDAFAYIAGRITGGSRGAWSEIMAPATDVTAEEAAMLSRAILSLVP